MYVDINDHLFEIFHRNNETVMGDDKNNTQMNNKSNSKTRTTYKDWIKDMYGIRDIITGTWLTRIFSVI